MIRNDFMCLYDATLKPCAHCGNAEQQIFGIKTSDGWKWDIYCKSCGNQFVGKESESEVIELWNRRFSKDDIEEDGYITWKRFRDRYVRELTDNINGRYDRAD